ncbi:MAG: hypothetical protein LBJ73_00665 [Rickettsiales bacterium]|jgi:hypothetical protein|nr:hypothetical protein [Rickettsiales bacterium]
MKSIAAGLICIIACVANARADVAGNAYIDAHAARTDNPHSVTATQVGLGNVQNLDQTNAANITAGILDAARIPIGTNENTVLAGDDARFDTVELAEPWRLPADGRDKVWYENGCLYVRSGGVTTPALCENGAGQPVDYVSKHELGLMCGVAGETAGLVMGPNGTLVSVSLYRGEYCGKSCTSNLCAGALAAHLGQKFFLVATCSSTTRPGGTGRVIEEVAIDQTMEYHARRYCWIRATDKYGRTSRWYYPTNSNWNQLGGNSYTNCVNSCNDEVYYLSGGDMINMLSDIWL